MADVFDDIDELESEDEEQSPSKSKLPMVTAVIGLLGLGGGAYLAYGCKNVTDCFLPSAMGGETAERSEAPLGPMISLDTFVVNLNEPDEMRYLKCSVSLEATSDDAAVELESRSIRIRNTMLLYLSSLSVAQTRGIEKKQTIQQTLAERVNQIVGTGSIRSVYLTEFVVQ
jgi:flagellar FliL protein